MIYARPATAPACTRSEFGSGTTSYAWDSENRLTSVTMPSGGVISFAYDPFGRRIRKVSPAGTTIYAYDRKNIIEELSGTGSLQERYTYGPGTDEPLVGQRQPKIFFYEADGLGSVASLTDPTGALAATYSYDSFGFLTSSTGSATNWFRYTARQFDSDTGLYYYRARYYDPTIGRFISEDPIHFKGGINFYVYVSNRPTRYFDPNGESQADLAKLRNFLQDVIDQMTQEGIRTDPGWWNNIASTFGGPYLGCADQTKVVNDQYDSNRPALALDDNWNFQTHTSWGGAHTYGVLESPNQTDPDLYVDPLNNVVRPVPKGTK